MFLILLTVIVILSASVGDAAKVRYSPKMYFKLGKQYTSEDDPLDVIRVIPDWSRRNAKIPAEQRIALQRCEFVGLEFYDCEPPMSVVAYGVPSAKKVLSIGGRNFVVNYQKDTGNIQIFDEKGLKVIKLTPTDKVVTELVSSYPKSSQTLLVPKYNGGAGKSLIKGPGDQVVYTVSYESPSYFFTLKFDGTLIEPSKTEVLLPTGQTSDSYTQFNIPAFYNGTHYAFRCRCGGDEEITFDNKVFIPLNAEQDSGHAFVNGKVWTPLDWNSEQFSVYDLASGTTTRFNPAERSEELFKANFDEGGYHDGWTLSPDGSILYLINKDFSESLTSLKIIGISTVTGKDVSLFKGVADLQDDWYDNCGVFWTADGLTVCLVRDHGGFDKQLHLLTFDVLNHPRV